MSFAVVIYFLLPNSNLLDVRAASRKVQLWQKCGYVRIALTPNRHIGDKAAFTLVDRCGCYICQCWIATEMRWNKNAVSRSSLVAALDGWTHLSEKIHRGRSVDAFLRRSKRCGFCPSEVAGYDQLLEEADDQLFKRILYNRHHTLYQLLPPQSTASQKYNLRRRTHDRQLHDHQRHLSDCNFITRLLYRNSY